MKAPLMISNWPCLFRIGTCTIHLTYHYRSSLPETEIKNSVINWLSIHPEDRSAAEGNLVSDFWMRTYHSVERFA